MYPEPIQEISATEAQRIVETRHPPGRFLTRFADFCVAIDNTTGYAWTEEFRRLDEAIEWLLYAEKE